MGGAELARVVPQGDMNPAEDQPENVQRRARPQRTGGRVQARMATAVQC